MDVDTHPAAAAPLPSATPELKLRPPPQLPDAANAGGPAAAAGPVLGSLGSVVMLVSTGSAVPGGQSRSLLAAGTFVVTTLLVVALQLDRQRRRRQAQVELARAAYHHHLAEMRDLVQEASRARLRTARRRHPAPAALPSLVAGRPPEGVHCGEEGPLEVRYALGDGPPPLTLVAPPDDPERRGDPAAERALLRFLSTHAVQRGLPQTIDLRRHRRIEACGEPDAVRAWARALVCAAAASHPPSALTVAVLAPPGSLGGWEWCKWLPHVWSAVGHDAVGPRRLVCAEWADLEPLLPPDLRPGAQEGGAAVPHGLLVVDGAGEVPLPLPPAMPHAITVVELSGLEAGQADRPRADLTLHLEPGGAASASAVPRHQLARAVSSMGPPRLVALDRCDLATAEALARRLCPGGRVPSVAEDRGHGEPPPPPDLAALLGLGPISRYDASETWSDRPPGDRLRVPIGVADDGSPVHLDLKESAERGVGPHGLLVGATGSGKSELLRSLVLGLALTHPPDQLGLVLVDFKGGATFAGMAPLPHVSALITNLADDLALVERMEDALTGELLRRQELLRAAGTYTSVRDYELARAGATDRPALPSLLVVVDEFTELLTARPEFIDLFLTIGRLGRSLGLHLLLASQRLEEGRLRGLESHLSYRIALRTFSAQESRAVLGVPDAHELPATPGLGLLQTGRARPRRFTAAYVSGPASPSPPAEPRNRFTRLPATTLLPWRVAEVALEPAGDAEPGPPTSRPARASESTIDIAVRRLRGAAPRTHRLWLPPLEAPETLGDLMPDLAEDPRLGLVSAHWRKQGPYVLPIGTLDRPREQRRDTHVVDLRDAGGHVAVVGGPRTGTSTLLRTLVAGIAVTTTARESQLFVLDLGAGAWQGLEALPHVAAVATASEPDVVRRVVAEVAALLDCRERHLHDLARDFAADPARRALGRADDGYGEVFLVVDGWASLRADFPDLEEAVARIASRGLSSGFHLLTAATRWGDYRPGLRDLLGTRLELRLGDPLESEIDRRVAATVPSGRPGRGLAPGGLHLLTALPRLDKEQGGAHLDAGVEALAVAVAQAWTGPPAPPLRMLPERVDLQDVRRTAGATAAPGGPLLLGLREADLAPVGLDDPSEPHTLVLGDAGAGKSAALRTYLHEVMRVRTPQEAQLVVVDYRRSLLGEVPDAFLLHHLASAPQAAEALTDLTAYLDGRRPGPDVTAVQLRHRSWWTGAEVYVVVDDYDLVTTSQGCPVHALQPLLAHARDVGLHLVVARRTGGASRALFDPVLQTLRDLAMPGLLLSGGPEEGPLLGVRPSRSPPGRGRLVTRDRGVEVVQVAWREPVW